VYDRGRFGERHDAASKGHVPGCGVRTGQNGPYLFLCPFRLEEVVKEVVTEVPEPPNRYVRAKDLDRQTALSGHRYSYYDIQMNVHSSALKHGVDPDDSIRAATEYVFTADLEEGNPSRQLRLGFDSSGQLLEIVVLIFDESRELIIHSMKARPSYYDLLP
jgi:hypothetical protein